MSDVNRQVEILRLREELAQVKVERDALAEKLRHCQDMCDRLMKGSAEMEERLRWRKWPEEVPPYRSSPYLVMDKELWGLDLLQHLNERDHWYWKEKGVTYWLAIDGPEGVK